MKTYYPEIGKRIRTIRKQQGMSQGRLAEMAGVGTSHISHIENGLTQMTMRVLINIINALGISADELLCDHVYKAKEVLTDEMAVLLADCNNKELCIISDIVKSTIISLRKSN